MGFLRGAGGKEREKVKSLSRVLLFATPWTRLLRPSDFPSKSTGLPLESACQFMRQKRYVGSIPGSGRSERGWHPTPVLLPGESHGQKSLVGYSPLGCKELDMTEATQHAQAYKEAQSLLEFESATILGYSGSNQFSCVPEGGNRQSWTPSQARLRTLGYMVTHPVDSKLCARCLQKWHTNGKPDTLDKRPRDLYLDSPLPERIC